MCDEAKALCSDCAVNPFLKARILQEGTSGDCSVCKAEKFCVFELGQLATIICNSVIENFLSDNSQYFESHAESLLMKGGDPLENVIAEMLGQDLYFINELVEAVIRAENYDPQKGDISFFDADLYTPFRTSASITVFDYYWTIVSDELKHKRRFFSESVKLLFDDVFKDIETQRMWTTENGIMGSDSVVETFEEGFKVFRARPIQLTDLDDFLTDPLIQVGPPPRHKARANRMSAEGVVMLYCSKDYKTAIAETRPAIGTKSAVVELEFTRPLRLLNFERLERLLERNWQMYLDNSHGRGLHQSRRDFLKRLHNLISLPVVPGNESDYLVTQCMAEYLGHVHPSKFDGIVFKSVQRQGGSNLAIFPDPNEIHATLDIFSIKYVDKSLRFHVTEQVSYEHAPKVAIKSSHGPTVLMDEDEANDARGDAQLSFGVMHDDLSVEDWKGLGNEDI